MAAAPDPDEVLRSTSGKGNFQRVARLLISGGTTLLREIFDQLCPPSNVPTILKNPATAKQLKAAKLTKPQWDCLYPSPGVYGKSVEFDVSLLFKLLKTICGLSPPATGWDVLPTETDASLTADLARIKYYRNSVYGHVNHNMEISDEKFPLLWQEIKEALVRVSGHISYKKKTEWQEAIDNFLKDPLTAEDERNVKELLSWYRNDMEVKKSVEELKSTTQKVIERLEEKGQNVVMAVREESQKMKFHLGEGMERLETSLKDVHGRLEDKLQEVHQSIARLSSQTEGSPSSGGFEMAEGGSPDVNYGTLPSQARWLIGGFPNFGYQLREYCASGRRHTTILLCGKTGVGKSHLTNALIGKVLAKEGEDLDPETDEVTPYNFTINNVKITVFDTPGLADGTGNEEEYLEKIKEKLTVFDVFIFCTEMNSRRFRNDDIKTVQKLTEAFGSQLWKHAVVVLTFANEVHPPPSDRDVNIQEFFDQRVRVFKKKIQEVFLNVGVPGDVVINVPFVAAGDLSEPRLPGIDSWLTAFWIATFKRLNRSARPTFLLANVDRFNCISLSEQISRGSLPFRTGVPPRQLLEGKQVQRQMKRRSFQGFEHVYHDQCSDDNADSDGVRRPFTRRQSMVETRTPPHQEPKTKPKGFGNGKGATNDAPAIDLDEPSAKEIMMEILPEFGKEDSKDGTKEDSKEGTEKDSKDRTEEDSKDGTEENNMDGTKEDSKDGTEENNMDGTKEDSKDGTEEERRMELKKRARMELKKRARMELKKIARMELKKTIWMELKKTIWMELKKITWIELKKIARMELASCFHLYSSG
ncbi:hypothetical protein ACROYT_G024651 [Oculina patagonica]